MDLCNKADNTYILQTAAKLITGEITRLLATCIKQTERVVKNGKSKLIHTTSLEFIYSNVTTKSTEYKNHLTVEVIMSHHN